jgi:DMSO/TMAO reductase YedYZ molybdopterin-dependent catalytic subunit
MSLKLTRISLVLAATLTIVILASSFTYSTSSKAKISSVEQTQIHLDYGELITMPRTTVYAELSCIGYFIDSGNWTGVRLGLVLEKAGLIQQAESVEFYASDGYSTSMPYSEAMREDIIIAYEKDGSKLPEVTRLVIPNANGGEWISKIYQIKIVNPSGNLTSLYLN